MNEEVKSLVIEHHGLVDQQGQNLKELAKLNHEFDNWQDKKAFSTTRLTISKAIDQTRKRILEIEQELYALAGLPSISKK